MPGRSSGLRMTADDDSVHVHMGYKETSYSKVLIFTAPRAYRDINLQVYRAIL